jgi:2-C-methyl-D-erythritol 2,4-cyclodiphosphate synthase
MYLQKAIETLGLYKIAHVSISIEAKRPHLSDYILPMRRKIAEIIGVTPDHIGITATTGEGLTSFGRGEGIQAFVILTVEKNS